jgi:hypothetical protein
MKLHREVAFLSAAGRRALWLSPLAILVASATAFAGTVYGKVTSKDRPISTILLFTDQDGQKASVRTDASGRYELILPPGDYSITAAVGDVSPATITVFSEPHQQDLVVKVKP